MSLFKVLLFNLVLAGAIYLETFLHPWCSKCQNDWPEVNLPTKLGEGSKEGVGMFLNKQEFDAD